VAVARTGFQVGGGVTVTNAELAKIQNKPGSFGKSELLVKLQAIRRDRDVLSSAYIAW
jgi:hypothetical protein